MDWLSEIEERERLASEAPWVIHSDCLAHPVQVSENEWEAEQLSEYIEGEENREFIANAREDIPLMARVLRELARVASLYRFDIATFHTCGWWDNFSDDAKELCVAAKESSRE